MLTMIERCRISIEHRRGGHAVVGESGIPAAEGKIRSEDHRAMFIALLYDLEAQVGVLATHRQIADLVDDQQLVDVNRTMHGLSVTVLTCAASSIKTRTWYSWALGCGQDSHWDRGRLSGYSEGLQDISRARARRDSRSAHSSSSTKCWSASVCSRCLCHGPGFGHSARTVPTCNDSRVYAEGRETPLWARNQGSRFRHPHALVARQPRPRQLR